MKIKKFTLATITTAILTIAVVTNHISTSHAKSSPFSASADSHFKKDDLIELEITTAPFQVDKKYKSMEGPMQILSGVSIEQILALGKSISLKVPASEKARLVRNTIDTVKSVPNSSALGKTGGDTVKAIETANTAPKELYWFLGVEIEVLDPVEDKVISGEYMCHFNMDIDQTIRRSNFPESYGNTARLFILTSGATELDLPKGFGVPMTNDEPMTMYFQVLNHNFDADKGKFEVRHRLKLYLVKDSALTKGLKPLDFHCPFIAVPLEENVKFKVKPKICPCCTEIESGKNAPQNKEMGFYTGEDGKQYSGHWEVPKGETTYNFPLRYFPAAGKEFAEYDTTIHAAIPHVHPFTTSQSVIKHGKECKTSETILKQGIVNRGDGKVGMIKADIYSSEEGIPIKAEDDYELSIAFNNTTGEPQDAMGCINLYTLDKKWKRPSWAVNKNITTEQTEPEISDKLESCGVKLPEDSTNNNKNDNNEKKEKMLIKTTLGEMTVELFPQYAPQHVRQIKLLVQTGCYNDLPIFRIEPGFVAQVAPVEQRDGGLNETQNSLLKDIPLETTKLARHEKGSLSMARWPDQPNGARSSFSFLLGPAPHLDNEYTIFGKVVKGLEVLDLIEKNGNTQPEKPASEKNPTVKIKEIKIISE